MGTSRRQPAGTVRIIGGRWRRHRIGVADVPALRPSADRVRETLFNWLAPTISGAHCLDLFAGTGVLAFEAMSRDAASATLIDDNPEITGQLQREATALGAAGVTIITADALDWLARSQPTPFDIVFVDPPFHRDMLLPALRELRRGWLKAHARVYLEAEKIPILPIEEEGWRVHRRGHTRRVEYALVVPV